MAGSSITVAHSRSGSIGKIVATCTGDDTDGTFPNTALPAFNGHLLALVTNPGSTGPTASYDITVEDADGLDRLQGVGANRHTSNSEQAVIVYSSTSIHPPVFMSDVLTLKIANSSVNNATVVITIYYKGA